MKKFYLIFLLLVLVGCSNKNISNTTTPDIEDESINNNEVFDNIIEFREFSIIENSEYDFNYDDFYIDDNKIIKVENKRLKALKSGVANLTLKLNNIIYNTKITVLNDDLKEFEDFIIFYKVNRNYTFKVYGGLKYYEYKSDFIDYYFLLDDLDITYNHIKNNTKARPGIKRDIKWIVIHDTGNIKKGADASNHNKYITNLALENKHSISWHYTIDDSYIYNHIPDNEVAWHAGDGMKNVGEGKYLGGGNKNGIGLEICIDEGNNVFKSIQKTAQLAAYLCLKYDLEIDDIKRHKDFANKNCPYTILVNDMWDDFIKMVEFYILLETKYSNFEIDKINQNYHIKNLISGNTRQLM